MSARRKIGDKITTIPNVGFIIGGPYAATIPDTPANKNPDACMICDDPACLEWPDVWAKDNTLLLCHVSECQMEDFYPCGDIRPCEECINKEDCE